MDKLVLLLMIESEELPRARLGLQNDLDSMWPFDLFTEKHDVYNVLHCPHVGQLEQFLKHVCISIEDRDENESLFLNILAPSIDKEVSASAHIKIS